MKNFSFDDWKILYKTDPQEFERKRKEVIEQEINKAPISIRNKLRVIQMECDVIHQTNTPLDATIQISNLMVDKLHDMQNSIFDLSIKIQNMYK